ncbi:hypothetical protein HMPREF2659_09605 [Pseudomonas aeruginosa]|uniref:hypothetical protein n=1 Tax=Pseudomonas aeruginosa TaxID=287 RepID=UPI0008A8AB86|nr:hypothetical protein [Pseudomonas aeruginosa]OHP05252.1 hypothetical protein HMPREF2659_09605 [Pseudomonas aeruginosa]
MTTKAVFAPDDEVSFLYREKHRCRGIVLSSHAQGYAILKCTSGYAEGKTLAVNFPALKRIDPEPASASLAGPRQSDIFAAGAQRLQMTESIELTIQSMQAYGADHEHWAVAWAAALPDSTGHRRGSAVSRLICRLNQDQCPASSVASLGYHGYGKPRTTRIPHRPRAFRCDHLSL